MTTPRSIAVLALALATASACEPEPQRQAGDIPPAGELVPGQTSDLDVWLVSGIKATRKNGANIPAGGFVQFLVPEEGIERGLYIAVNARGMPEGSYGWGIYRNACTEDPGDVVVPVTDVNGMEGIAEPLRAGRNGNAEQSVFIPASVLPPRSLRAEDLSLRIHEGPDPRGGGRPPAAPGPLALLPYPPGSKFTIIGPSRASRTMTEIA